jgi:hypothetical protein
MDWLMVENVVKKLAEGREKERERDQSKKRKA